MRAQDPVHIYEAYYQVDYGDIPEWNRLFNQYAVPILNDLREEGVIQGYSHWQHQTGGSDYNVRFTARTFDWQALDSFWSEYLARLAATVPEAENAAMMGMIQAHKDEIWDVSTLNVPQGAQTAYMYAATYRYNFADGAEWHRMWNEVAGPVIDQAMEEGLLEGWATLDHNTGGAHNYKVLYMFEDWDHIDDFFNRVMGRLQAEHPAEFQAVSEMMKAHDDVIWVPATAEGM
jgi:hypothetical protein